MQTEQAMAAEPSAAEVRETGFQSIDTLADAIETLRQQCHRLIEERDAARAQLAAELERSTPPQSQSRDEGNPPTIVAEISRNWSGDDGRPLISTMLERVVEVNRHRGYQLYSWRLSRLMIDGVLNETIIAVFEKAITARYSENPPPIGA